MENVQRLMKAKFKDVANIVTEILKKILLGRTHNDA